MPRNWKLEVITPHSDGNWAEIPLSDTMSREAAEEIVDNHIRQEGRWEFRIVDFLLGTSKPYFQHDQRAAAACSSALSRPQKSGTEDLYADRVQSVVRVERLR